MDSESLIASCGERLEENPDFVRLDISRVLTRLLLFDSYTLECALRLRDVVALVRAIGIENVGLLLTREGGLRLAVKTTSVVYPTSSDQSVHDPMGFNFMIVRVADSHEHLKTSLSELERISGIKHRKLSRLSQRVSESIIEPATGDMFGNEALHTLKDELAENSPILRSALDDQIKRRGLDATADYGFRVHQRDDGSVLVETDLARLLGLSLTTARDLVGRAMVGVGGLDLRFEQMQAFGSVTAFNDDDYALMDRRLSALTAELGEDTRAHQFGRVIRLLQLPSLEDADLSSLDFGRFVELRQHPAMRDFRHWLSRAGSASDSEIAEQAANVRSRVADAITSRAARGVRFALTTGAGVVPVVGTVAGSALGALDSFVVDKVAGEPGPIAVFARRYPSIFGGA